MGAGAACTFQHFRSKDLNFTNFSPSLRPPCAACTLHAGFARRAHQVSSVNPRVPKVCGARHTRARSRDHKKSETLLGQHSATVGTELCLSCNKWCSIRGWNYGTDSSFYASFLHFQCTSTHQRKRQRSKCAYWYFFTNNIPTIFK